MRALALLPFLALAPRVGHAAEGLILLDRGPVLADGEQSVSLELRGPALTPTSTLKIKSDQGRVSDLSLGEGGATFRFTPEAQSSPTQATLELRLRGPSGEQTETLRLDLRPAGRNLALLASPPVAEAGQPVLLSLSAPPGPQDPKARAVWMACTTGALSPPQIAPDGTITATWTPPKDSPASVLALCGATDAAAPADRVASAVIPIKVRRSVTFQAPPESTVYLDIQGERLGPYTVSPAGSFAVDLALDPRAAEASVEVHPRVGKTSTSTVPLPPSAGQAALLPLPPRLVADPDQPYVLTLVAARRDGGPHTGEAPRVEATTGQLSPPKPAGPGRWTLTWTPPAAGASVRFTTRFEGAATTVDRPLSPAPTRLGLTAQAPATAKGKTTLAATLQQADGAGQITKGSAPNVQVFGAPKAGGPLAQGSAWRQAVNGGPAVIVAAPAGLKPTGLPPAALVLDAADPSPALTDGLPVRVVVLDALGVPVPKVPVALRVTAGSGTIAPSATTDAAGAITLRYQTRAPAEPARIEAAAAGLVAAVVLQAGPAAGPLGDPGQQAALARARQLGGLLPLLPPAPPPVVASPVAAPIPASAPLAAPTPASAPLAASSPASAPAAPPVAAARPPATAPAADPVGRLALHVAALGEDYTLSTDAGEVAYTAGAPAGEALDSALGAGFSALLWPGAIGLDLRLAARKVVPAAEIDLQEAAATAALRLRRPLGPLDGYATAGLASRAFDLFLGDPDGPTQKTLYGGLLGAGVQRGGDGLFGELGAEAFLGPYPVEVAAHGLLDIPLGSALALRLQAEAAQRQARFAAGDTELALTETRTAAGLGLVYRLP